jgi:hypothetical protein
LLGAGLLIALLLAWWVDGNAQSPGEQAAAAIEGPLGAVPASGAPTSSPLSAYSVTYRITEPDTPVQVERKVIDRPFWGRDITYNPKGRPTSGAVTGPGGAYLFLTSPQPHWGLLETGTYRATGDDQAAAGLALAVRYHRAKVIGTRRVLGRLCTVVRTNGPIGAGVSAPDGSNYTDICLDQRTGQMLDEVWVLDKKLVRERRAVSFDPHPAITVSDFSVPSTGPAVPEGTSGSTEVVQLTPTDMAHLPVSMTAPAGYRLDGAQAQVTLEQQPGGTTPSQNTEIVTHFDSGPQLIDLLQGGFGSPPSGGIPIRLADGPSATLTIDLIASYLDTTRGGQAVRVEGTDLADLTRAAGGLKTQNQAS